MLNGNCFRICYRPLSSLGRPRQVDLRAVVNAIFYLVAAGCAWRLLPHDFPHWKTVYHYFRQWRWDGTWERIHQRLVEWVRVMDGRQATQGAASLDSQSVKTATPASMEVGYDGGKKVKGRKRHLMVDTLGLVLMVVVTAAHISDRQGARLLFARLAKVPQRTRRLLHIWVDGTLARGGLDEVDNGHLSLGARNHQPFRFDEGVCSIAQALGGRTHLGLAQLVSALVKGL